MRGRLAATLLLSALAAGGPSARAGEPTPFERALEKWRDAHGLRERVDAARKLADTGDPGALKELLAEFGKPSKHQDKFTELVAPELARAFAAPEFAPTFRDAFAGKLDQPEHAWLAYQVASAWSSDGRADAAVGLCLSAARRPFHQAAVLRALGFAPNANAWALAQDVLAMLPETEPDRTLLLEAAARVVEANAPPAGRPLRDAVEPLLVRLDEKQTGRRTAVVLGRTIARMLGSDVAYADASSWRRFMDDRDVAAKLAKEGYAPSRSYFAGVVLTGRDLVYVIDSSGSMAKPFAWRPTDPPQAPQAPETPAAKDDPDAERRRRQERARREQDVFESLKALPWDKIHTRLDAVREALKASLRALEEDQRFAVIVFSNDARFLASTPHLEAATHANVEGACADVDRLRADGATNAHRALELAFGASRTKTEDPASGVGVDQILQGADTIVLLTDGDPTTDSYEMRGEASLYARVDNVLVAARRWNLLFDAELDSVGLSGSSAVLLDTFADIGRGQARYLGR